MRVNLVAALDRGGVIGRDGGLPWKLGSDLARFRQITMGHPILMGRRTHESIGKPLPGRLNLVLSRDRRYLAPGCVVVTSLEAALEACTEVDELMVVGGAAVYAAALPHATRLFLTEVDAEAAGDVRFPPFDRKQWRETLREPHAADVRNEHAFCFLVLERDAPAS